LSAYLDTSVLLPTLIAEPMTEAVYDYLGADRQELLISDFVPPKSHRPYRASSAWPCSLRPTQLRVWRTSTLGVRR
jgi:hypothetical protein